MAHRAARDAYRSLSERLNRFAQGAPPSELLFKILRILFSEKEAGLVASLPIKPFTAAKAALIWKKSESEARAVLEALAGRGLLIDYDHHGTSIYSLPPPMAGFFEFSLMRVRDDIDQKLLSELFFQYLNVEEEFIRALFVNGPTQLGRVFVHEPAIPEDNSLHVLDYERASETIKAARHRAVGVCYCRHKMSHVGKACDAPMDICLTFGNVADSLSRHGIARKIGVKESLDLLQQAQAGLLVQFGENVRRKPAFICNCCGCCCEALVGIKRFGSVYPIHTNFIPRLDPAVCTGCGKCIDICPVQALGLVSANDPARPKRRLARLEEKHCLGCGVCVRVCPNRGLRLEARPGRVLTPLDTTHRAVVMAIERGTLPHLLFDNRAHWNHRAMAAALGVIVKLPPLKQALASRQLKSRYLEYLVKRMKS
ncbi:MAG: 4Fe-4S dicluster domain-containing protein [Acidobacteriota bacterium]|nr:4Fe-4S dicluster domain-containing protein [Acidobacteriota bacterium]